MSAYHLDDFMVEPMSVCDMHIVVTHREVSLNRFGGRITSAAALTAPESAATFGVYLPCLLVSALTSFLEDAGVPSHV